MKHLKYLLPLGFCLSLMGLLAVGLTLDPTEVPSPLVGKRMPAFSLPTLADPDRVLSDRDLVGDVTVVNVWASWCAACRIEHPLLFRLARESGVRLYGLNYKDVPQDAARWLDQLGDPYSVSLTDVDGQVGIDWGVYGVPETFVLDRRGVVRYKHIGPVTVTDLERRILPLLAELSGEAAR